MDAKLKFSAQENESSKLSVAEIFEVLAVKIFLTLLPLYTFLNLVL
jgi:hypothetical protein